MSRRQRRSFSSGEKVAILRRHLADKIPVSDLGEEHKLQLSVFYEWQRQLLDHAARALEPLPGNGREERGFESKTLGLETRQRRKDSVSAEIFEESVTSRKGAWRALNSRWALHKLRDEVGDFVGRWPQISELPILAILRWPELSPGKFYRLKQRYGHANDHNGKTSRDFWHEPDECRAIVDFPDRHPLEEYQCLSCMMLDQDVVAISLSSVNRVLRTAGRLDRWNPNRSGKNTGFGQRPMSHQLWHSDVPCANVGGIFSAFIDVLDSYSRFLLHWELNESMTEGDVEIALHRARKKGSGPLPRIISDNLSASVASDFKTLGYACRQSARSQPGESERKLEGARERCLQRRHDLSFSEPSIVHLGAATNDRVTGPALESLSS